MFTPRGTALKKAKNEVLLQFANITKFDSGEFEKGFGESNVWGSTFRSIISEQDKDYHTRVVRRCKRNLEHHEGYLQKARPENQGSTKGHIEDAEDID